MECSWTVSRANWGSQRNPQRVVTYNFLTLVEITACHYVLLDLLKFILILLCAFSLEFEGFCFFFFVIEK